MTTHGRRKICNSSYWGSSQLRSGATGVSPLWAGSSRIEGTSVFPLWLIRKQNFKLWLQVKSTSVSEGFNSVPALQELEVQEERAAHK